MKSTLVIDTNSFINSFYDVRNLVNKFHLITTRNVISEIKDKKTREKFDIFFKDIDIQEP